MSAYNRYSFTKKVYPDYVVLLLRKDKDTFMGKVEKSYNNIYRNERISYKRYFNSMNNYKNSYKFARK